MEENTQNKKSFKGIAIFLALLSIALLVVIFYQSSRISDLRKSIGDNQQVIFDQENTIETQVAEIESLVDKYESIKVERDSMGLSNEALQEKVKSLNSYLYTIKQKGKLTNAELQKYKDLVAQYEQDLLLKDEQLTKLKAAYDTLQSTSELQKVEMEMMTKQMIDLESQVEIASVLKAENIAIYGINDKGKEYDGGEYKQKRTEKIKVVFNIADNKVAKKNTKMLYLRVLDPSGTTLSGSSTFESVNGKRISYTVKESLRFNNTNQEVDFIYTKGSDYNKGTYLVEIYAEGSLIGKKNFLIK